MRILIASDSFKGCFSSAEAASLISAGIEKALPGAIVDIMQVADGGEGTASVLSDALGGEVRKVPVFGPAGNPVEALFSILPGGEAIMDMASASGLTLVPDGKRDIMGATTYGVGQLILAALDAGCRRIMIGIGGSATHDGGIGMAEALGVRFYDSSGRVMSADSGSMQPALLSAESESMQPALFSAESESMQPALLGADSGSAQPALLSAKDLSDIAKIDTSGLDKRLSSAEVYVLCDVENPLCGPEGAAYTYGAQKGAGLDDIDYLDRSLGHYAEVVKRETGLDLAEVKGIGAAGGIALSLIAFTGAKMRSGIDYILDATGFDDRARAADLVITGEGKIDAQSAYGKAISGIAKRATTFGVPVAAVCGSIDGDIQDVYAAGICAVEAAVCRPMTISEALENASENLINAAERLTRAISTGLR